MIGLHKSSSSSSHQQQVMAKVGEVACSLLASEGSPFIQITKSICIVVGKSQSRSIVFDSSYDVLDCFVAFPC